MTMRSSICVFAPARTLAFHARRILTRERAHTHIRSHISTCTCTCTGAESRDAHSLDVADAKCLQNCGVCPVALQLEPPHPSVGVLRDGLVLGIHEHPSLLHPVGVCLRHHPRGGGIPEICVLASAQGRPAGQLAACCLAVSPCRIRLDRLAQSQKSNVSPA